MYLWYQLITWVCHNNSASSRDTKLYRPEHTGHFVQPHVAAHCGGDIYSRRKPLFSSFGEHTAVCGSSVRQAVARPRHRQSVCIHNIHVALVCSGPPQCAARCGWTKWPVCSGPIVWFKCRMISFQSSWFFNY